ncbi:MAG: alpha-galactosidase [Bacteroidota bacterium]|nr:alpha-galactosidase [Bacteroidota bacterium]
MIDKATNEPFISGATSAINTNYGTQTTLAPNYTFNDKKTKVVTINDKIGSGKRVSLFGTDNTKKLTIEWRIALYDRHQFIVFETICKNSSSEAIQIKSIEPLRVLKAEAGSLYYPNASKCLLNGAMYYDAGSIHTLGTPYIKSTPYGETKGGIMQPNSLSLNDETVQSWWNLGLFSGYDNNGMSIGYIENQVSLGRIQLLKTGRDQLSFVVESVYDEGFSLKKNQTISSDKVMINIAPNPYRSLEDYAETVGKVNGSKVSSPVNGWCNWFYTLDDYTEEEIVRNAEFASNYLRKYGLEYIQIDEGYQKFHGDWEGNARFPHGMKWLAQKIKDVGLKPGIWIAPFVVSDTTAVFKEHPDWFLKNEDGSLKRIGPWPGENTDWFKSEQPKRYCLDITHPEAEKWFTDLIDTIANNWGYQLIKVDFVAWTVFSAHHFYNASYTPAMVYRKAFEIMRKVAGDSCHILDCGPGQVTAGLLNSMRIEYDQNYGYSADAWKQYFIGSSSSAGALGKRYFFHHTVWTNDIDHLCMDMLSPHQSQAAASIIALSGGNTMSGDRLVTLDKTKLEILKKAFPSANSLARPIDLFDDDPQTAFASTIKRSFGEWTVAGFFNPDLTTDVQRHISLKRLWLDPDKIYLCYDFWKEQFLGEVIDSMTIHIDPASVTLLSFHEKKNIPQVISTSRHIMQGAVELKDVSFNFEKNSLSGISVGPANTSYSVIVYIPDAYDWSPRQRKMYDDFTGFSVKKVNNHLLRIDLHFGASGRVEWAVSFNKQ